eukprot:142234-Lingulodinium_polyedra.AAC.1
MHLRCVSLYTCTNTSSVLYQNKNMQCRATQHSTKQHVHRNNTTQRTPMHCNALQWNTMH